MNGGAGERASGRAGEPEVRSHDSRLTTHDSPPDRIENVGHLEEMLSEPTTGVVEMLGGLDGDVLVLGAAGKMGPSLARMARRALDAAGSRARVIAVSRFSAPDSEAGFHAHNVETVRCDLLDLDALAGLPEVPNVVYMAGMKFGSTGGEPLTWALNAFLPGLVCRRFRNSRIAAFSTGNVYPFTPPERGGSVETDPPAPVGEYAQSCLGRERIFEHFSGSLETPVSIIRLNYAVEMRYGVLADLARRVYEGQPVALEMGWFNCIWQADANAMALQSLAHASSPPLALNVTGPELLSVRQVCMDLGSLLGREPTFTGQEASDALLSNAARAFRLFGGPRVDAAQLLRWTADWVSRGGASLDKPTHFEEREGRF